LQASSGTLLNLAGNALRKLSPRFHQLASTVKEAFAPVGDGSGLVINPHDPPE